MNIKEFTELIKVKPYIMGMGKGLLSRRYNISPEDVLKAKNIYTSTRQSERMPKILLFDIETSPMKAYIWNLWKTNVHPEQLTSDWFCIAWSAKWLYSGDIMGEVLTPQEIKQENDYRIMLSLWKLINEADIVITHNGNKFDIPRINARFIIHGFQPTTPYYSIDTCQVARKQFGFTSNKLDCIAGYFNIAHKLETSFNLWKECLEGDEEALSYMLEYNKMDVKILEEVYLKLRPWIKGHPNIANYIDSDCCCNCGSVDIREIPNDYYYTQVNKYKLYRCRECGAVSRGRKPINKSKISMVNNMR